MAVSFMNFSFRNMFSLGNSLCLVLFSFVIPVLYTLYARFSWACNQRSQINGVAGDEVGESPDDQNQLGSEILRLDSGFKSLCEEESSFESRSIPNATTSKYEFLGGNSFCGYIEEPQTTSFKVQELFLDSAFEDGVADEQSVCRDLQEADGDRKAEDSVDQKVEEQRKIEDSATNETSLDENCGEADMVKTEDFIQVDQKGVREEIENFVSNESSLDKNCGEVVDMVKTEDFIQVDQKGVREEIEYFVTDESSLDKNCGEVVDMVKTEDFIQVDQKGVREEIEDFVTNESFLDKNCGEVVDTVKTEDVREFDHMETTEGFNFNEPRLDGEDIRSSIIISSHDEEALAGEVVNLDHDCVGGRSEVHMEEEGLISLDPVQSPLENKFMFSFNHVRQEPVNDFWHTNGKFIADFDKYYSYQSDDEEDGLAPETPMCLDTMSVDLYEENISGSDSMDSDSDDDNQDCVINHGEEEEECWEKSSELQMEEMRNHVLDEDDEMDIDVLLQHQSYVKKMKKEMKQLRTNGLPTILEDLESPRMDEDLKPLKINEKVGFKDQLDEVQRFYKTYLDKMKRLDILCHQTMYAVGFLQLKNPDQLAANKKLSIPSIKSLLPHNLLPNKFRRHESDPVQKLMRDLHRDLELVYVGQLCLSWEILKWQHTKAEELQQIDTMGFQHYSVAAGEFQQFQVLVHRFTEDEPFQSSPRVENYVNSRCSNSSFLQVPPLKDDSKNTEGKAIMVSIVRLTDIIEESMHAFWEFIRNDKKEMGNLGLHDPLDAELLSDIRTNLAKKERRIKDLVRSGNCIVKKFQKKHQDFQLTHELLLAQVELKLVARVIGMSRLTEDQLMWCHKKLSKISIVGKQVYLESSFSLFPC